MIYELNERKTKVQSEFDENQKNPEKLATNKGQYIQNLEDTKKRDQELSQELLDSEKNLIPLIRT